MQRTRPLHPGCNRTPLRAWSLSSSLQATSVYMRITLPAVFCLTLPLVSCNRNQPDVQGYPATDAVLTKAYSDARSTVQEFISQFGSPKPDYRYLVKVRIEAEGQVEHVWLEPVRYENGVFRGRIANAPVKITSIKKGDVVEAKPEEISDWVILDDSEAIAAGGFTQKAMESHQGIQP